MAVGYSIVEKRYAEAFVLLAYDKGAVNVQLLKAELKQIVDVFRDEPDLSKLLINPEVDIDLKFQLIDRIFGNNVNQLLIDFLKLLLKKNRISRIAGINEEFSEMIDKKEKVLNIMIITAFPLAPDLAVKIKDSFIRTFSANAANIRIEADTSLLGGFIAFIGDKVFDYSLRGKLSMLGKELGVVAG